jgi:hypothetical protein
VVLLVDDLVYKVITFVAKLSLALSAPIVAFVALDGGRDVSASLADVKNSAVGL